MGNQVFSSAIRFAELLNHGDLVRMSLAISIRFSPPVQLSGLPVRLWRKMLETGAAKKSHSVRSSFFSPLGVRNRQSRFDPTSPPPERGKRIRFSRTRFFRKRIEETRGKGEGRAARIVRTEGGGKMAVR